MTKRFALVCFLGFVFFVFVGLGVWQVERLQWKLDLIARVDARIHAAPSPAPAIAGPDDEYRRVSASGQFLNDREALVQAVTERGAGVWVLTPLKMADGRVLLVNRGFVPADKKDPASHAAPSAPATITGLLRLSEPKGGFLRSNDPKADRWFSRDVAAIAESRDIRNVAPYFVDADATPNPGGYPIGGLTVVSFPNNHLQYALTWFAMAILSVVAGVIVLRRSGERSGD
jgi:surfeit locus 1 family protein